MTKFFTNWAWGYLTAVTGWVLSFLMPITPFLVFTVVLVMCDLYTGTKAAIKRKEEINSRGLKRTVEKITLYFIAILLSEGMRVVFAEGYDVPFAYITSLAIALTEFKSNIENVETVTGVKIWVLIKSKVKVLSK